MAWFTTACRAGEAQITLLTTLKAGGPEIKFSGPKDLTLIELPNGGSKPGKCCICTSKVLYAIKLKRSE
jgi:hypothetical protein